MNALTYPMAVRPPTTAAATTADDDPRDHGEPARPVEQHRGVDLEAGEQEDHAQADVGDQLDLGGDLQAEDLRADQDSAEDQQDELGDPLTGQEYGEDRRHRRDRCHDEQRLEAGENVHVCPLSPVRGGRALMRTFASRGESAGTRLSTPAHGHAGVVAAGAPAISRNSPTPDPLWPEVGDPEHHPGCHRHQVGISDRGRERTCQRTRAKTLPMPMSSPG